MEEPKETPEANVFEIFSGRPIEGTMDDEFFTIEKERTLETLEELKRLIETDQCVGLVAVIGYRNGRSRELTTVNTVFSAAAVEYSATFMGGLEVVKQRLLEETME